MVYEYPSRKQNKKEKKKKCFTEKGSGPSLYRKRKKDCKGVRIKFKLKTQGKY